MSKRQPKVIQVAVPLKKEGDIPHSDDSEKAMICSAMLDPKAIVERYAETLKPEMFHSERHRIIWSSICSMFENNVGIDLISVSEHMIDDGSIDDAGGPEYVTELAMFIPTAANTQYYFDKIYRCYQFRKIQQGCLTGLKLLREDKSDFSPESVRDEIAGIMDVQSLSERESIKDSAMHYLDVLEKRATGGYEASSLDMPWYCMRSRDSDLLVPSVMYLSGAPSSGKTTFAMNLSKYWSMDLSEPGVFCSLEMSKNQIYDKFLAIETGVDLTSIIKGKLGQKDVPRITAGVNKIAKCPLRIADSSAIRKGSDMIGWSQISSFLAQEKRERAIKYAVVDYYQLIQWDGAGEMNTTESRVALSRAIKAFAYRYDIVLVVLASLNSDGGVYGNQQVSFDADDSYKLEMDGEEARIVWCEKRRNFDARWKERIGFDKHRAKFHDII